jgi:pyruvate dehydrogenase (quinone)
MLGMGDLLTQIERKTPVVQLILNNESLDFVNIEQQEAGFIPFGVKFNDPNFAEVAKAMGAKGMRIEEPGDVREGLEEALAYKAGPVVVDAVVDPFALAMPSHSPFHTVKGFTLSMAKQVLAGKMDSVITTIERNVKLIWSSPELSPLKSSVVTEGRWAGRRAGRTDRTQEGQIPPSCRLSARST